jgi:hypothetical protein
MDLNTINAITAQSLKEIQFARDYKQGKISNWQKNENLYYGVKEKSTESRANVDLGQMQEFVHTLLSKIDNPLVFKFAKRKEAQLQRVKRLNALRAIDQQTDNWDIKDIVGKKQAIMYGRAIYAYYADSEKGYKPHLENVDIYDFLIDPSGGGIDIESARYMGRYGIIKTRKELEEDTKKRIANRNYITESIKNILAGSGNNNETSQEEENKQVRTYGQGTQADKELVSPDKFKFWQWFTTYEGERYVLLMLDKGNSCIQIDKITDVFTPTKECELGMWPFWTWAAFPDMTEFWTPSYCDYVREPLMAQSVSINQMLDNAEAVNKPMKAIDTGAIEDWAKLKYRKDGVIPVKPGFDVNRAIQLLQVPSINTPIEVYSLLNAIQEKASGVTSGAKGVADEQGKVGIYEGNQMAEADRFGLLNKSYSFGYGRFAKLYQNGVKDHLIKKVAVEMIGPDGIETEEITRRDIFKKGDDFNVLVEASNAENLTSLQNQQVKLSFLNAESANPVINPKKLFELKAQIAGISKDEVKELMDTSEFGNADLMAECARDIESLLDDMIKPNKAANNAYRQKILDYMRDEEENMTFEQIQRFQEYFISLEPIVMENEMRALTKFETNQASQGMVQTGEPAPIKNNQPVEMSQEDVQAKV